MKKYNTPELNVELSSCEDIMFGSDTFVDVGGLWGSESTGETGDSTGAEG